jgi:hypothetical protein
VDLLHRQVTVAEQLTEVRGAFAVAPPKTAAGLRTVTLPTVAAEALAEHLAAYAEPGPDGLVFPAARRGPLRRSNFTRRVWAPATRAVGVEGLRFHDLRHTAATLAIAAGASTRELMARMGHASSAAALRYQHAMAGQAGAAGGAVPGGDEAQVDPACPPSTSWCRPRPPSPRTSLPAGVARGWHEAGRRARGGVAGERQTCAATWGGGVVGLPGLEPGTSSLSAIAASPPC